MSVWLRVGVLQHVGGLVHTSGRVADGSAQRYGQQDGRCRLLKDEGRQGDGWYVRRHCVECETMLRAVQVLCYAQYCRVQLQAYFRGCVLLGCG